MFRDQALILSLATAMLFCFGGLSAAKTFQDAYPEVYSQLDEAGKGLVASLDFKTGKVPVGSGIATLDLQEGYYFLDQQDARYVLSDLWGNPKDDFTLGMIFPASTSPMQQSGWGISVSFDEIGYVSDKDAAEYDYDTMLVEMRDSIAEENKQRLEAKYEPITLVGWAARPRYDAQGRKLYWAKELQFGTDPAHTLNYNIRVLGRKGVLVLNFIAGMEALPMIEAAVPDVLAMVSYTQGNRYADFVPSLDTVAAVGIGGLIAGKVAAKVGLIAMALVFLKKGAVVVLLAGGWVVRNLFSRKDTSA